MNLREARAAGRQWVKERNLFFDLEVDEARRFKYRALLTNALLYFAVAALYYTQYSPRETPRMNMLVLMSVGVVVALWGRLQPSFIAAATLPIWQAIVVHWAFSSSMGIKCFLVLLGPIILFAGSYTNNKVAAANCVLLLVEMLVLRIYENNGRTFEALNFDGVWQVLDSEFIFYVFHAVMILRYSFVITTLQNFLRTMHEKEQETLKRKQAFLAETTHEIRSPMTAVFQLAELLAAPDANATAAAQQGLVAALHTACRALMKFLNQFIDMARLDVAAVRATPFDLHTVVHDASLTFQAVAKLKRLTLTVEIDAGCRRFVRSDPLFLTKIIMNLVSNGLKFTDKGGVRVRARTERVAGAEWLECTVTDSGVGIVLGAGATAADLFEPYYRSTGDKSHVAYGATGLGLSICKQAVDKLHGTIDLHTSPSGTVATVRVPIVPASQDEAAQLVARSDEGGRSGGLPGMEMGDIQRDSDLMCVSVPEATTLATNSLRHTDSDPSKSRMVKGRGGGLLAAFEEDRAANLEHSGATASPVVTHSPLGSSRDAQSDTLDGSDTLLEGGVVDSPMVTRSSPDGSPLVPAAGSPSLPVRTPTQRLSVLFAEDTNIIRRVVKMSLERAGHRCVTAENGKVGLEKFLAGLHSDTERFDAVLLDVHMPVMNGYECCRAIRDAEKLYSSDGVRVPIIAVTANTTRDCRDECAASGMDAIVEKPFETPVLLGVVNDLLTGIRLTTKFALH